MRESVQETLDFIAEESVEEDLTNIVFAYGQNDVTAKADYGVTTASPSSAAMKLPVAVNAEGEAVLTNGDLQIYYWLVFYDFMNLYGGYASYFGMDYNLPLSQQASFMENRTWEQYFLESAVNQFGENYAMAMAAYEAGYELSEEDALLIEDIADPQGDFAAEAMNGGFESPEAYIQANFGLGMDLSNYQDYMRLYYAAYDYYTDQTHLLEEEATDERMESYYAENAESFAESRILNVNNVSVRHILITPEGEKDVVTGDYSQEAWLAAEAEIQDIYSRWQEDPTEEHFAALATELTDDTGSAEAGGLYEDFDTDDMVVTFSDWCFDQARAPGDTGIVKSEYGYHLIYFVEQTETKGWIAHLREQYVNENIPAVIAAAVEKYPVRFDFSQVRLFDMITYSLEQSEESTAPAESAEPVG